MKEKIIYIIVGFLIGTSCRFGADILNPPLTEQQRINALMEIYRVKNQVVEPK